MLRRTAAAAALLSALAAAVPPHAAFAHAFLKSADPQPDSVLPAPPPALRLRFTEDVRNEAVIVLRDAAGATITTPPAVPEEDPPGAKATDALRVTLPRLPPGTYTVEWHVTARDDGHRTRGSFRFTVRP